MDLLPPNTYAALRVDGKGFSKLTQDLRREGPFHAAFSDAMEAMALALAQEVQGAVAAYVGSDEVSVVFQDLGEKSEKWMGGRRDKIVSLSAAMATSFFQRAARERGLFPQELPLFDSRVLPLSGDPQEARAYLFERARSVANNSVTMLTHAAVGTAGIRGKGTSEKKALLRALGTPWEELPLRDRYGTLFVKVLERRTVSFEARGKKGVAEVERPRWQPLPFSQEGPFAEGFLPPSLLLPPKVR